MKADRDCGSIFEERSAGKEQFLAEDGSEAAHGVVAPILMVESAIGKRREAHLKDKEDEGGQSKDWPPHKPSITSPICRWRGRRPRSIA